MRYGYPACRKPIALQVTWLLTEKEIFEEESTPYLIGQKELEDVVDTMKRRMMLVYRSPFVWRLYNGARNNAKPNRNENVELPMIAGMLHDISSNKTMDTRDHAHKGAMIAGEILDSIGTFTDQEIDVVCDAIYHHNDKGKTHPPFIEVLIDADVLQHYLYNPFFAVSEHNKERLDKLKNEFGLLG